MKKEVVFTLPYVTEEDIQAAQDLRAERLGYALVP